MNELYNKLKKYTIDDAIEMEKSDRQFIALKNMWKKITLFNYSFDVKQNIYLSLIIANSIICYQLSGKGEDYWEEFSDYFSVNFENLFFSEKILSYEYIINSLSEFIKQSKNNKRFIDTKIKRLIKLKPFLDTFFNKEEFFYDNMVNLRDKLAKTMKQKFDAKTIVFAVKMFSYGSRNCFNKLNYFPEDIGVPIDSRLIKLFDKYSDKNQEIIADKKKIYNINEIAIFYKNLSKKLNISELHLDVILWTSTDI